MIKHFTILFRLQPSDLKMRAQILGGKKIHIFCVISAICTVPIVLPCSLCISPLCHPYSLIHHLSFSLSVSLCLSLLHTHTPHTHTHTHSLTHTHTLLTAEDYSDATGAVRYRSYKGHKEAPSRQEQRLPRI